MSLINFSNNITHLARVPAIIYTPINNFSMLSEKASSKISNNKKTLISTSPLTDKKKISTTSKVSKSSTSVKNSLTKKNLLTKKTSKSMSTDTKDEKIVTINFEVFGKVQGLFFF